MIELSVVSCTQSSPEDIEKTSIYRWYQEVKDTSPEIHLNIVFNNKLGLPTIYNRIIEEHIESGSESEYMLFVHDDVYIDDLKLVSKLKQAHEGLGYDIIGLAGAIDPTIKHPALWHHMSLRQNHRGFVVHSDGKTGSVFSSGFGITPSRVAIIDGLFMAIHLPSIKKSGWRFNENYDFHHYDLASCIDANKFKLKIGVFPIHVVHESHGLESLDEKSWKNSNEKFLKDYSR